MKRPVIVMATSILLVVSTNTASADRISPAPSAGPGTSQVGGIPGDKPTSVNSALLQALQVQETGLKQDLSVQQKKDQELSIQQRKLGDQITQLSAKLTIGVAEKANVARQQDELTQLKKRFDQLQDLRDQVKIATQQISQKLTAVMQHRSQLSQKFSDLPAASTTQGTNR